MNEKIWFIFCVSFLLFSCTKTEKPFPLRIADNLEFIGIAVEEPGYHVWGSSPIIGPSGKTHLFVARWPKEFQVDPGWRSHSEIAHYISENPEGPFSFSGVIVKGTEEEAWDKFGAHNPCIKKVNELYILLYIANDNYEQPPHPKNQRIGMMVSSSLYGPWKKAGNNGLILEPSTNPENWTFNSGNGVVNPAFLSMPDNKYHLYFKARGKNRTPKEHQVVMGLAVADNPAGPFMITEKPITSNQKAIEDGYAFYYNGKYYLLTTDNHGIFIRGGGILWESDDGIEFGNPQVGYDLINRYFNYDPEIVKHYYGPGEIKFERPQILIIDDKPAYLYVSSGHNVFGGDATVSYVLKINLEKIENQ